MKDAELLEACVADVNDYMRRGKEREASRSLMVYIEERFAGHDLESVDAFLARFRDDRSINLAPRHIVSILRTCHRHRVNLKEYDACLSRWYDELSDAGMERLLAGISYVQ
jgi:hypothetical protein